jgi:uncharacterized protein DUF3306
MNDPDNFLSRWSRRKRGGDVDNAPAERSEAQPDGPKVSPRDQAKQAVRKDDIEHPPAFDVTSLPPIESIGAGTDISAFMQAGVPAALRHAALRRAWTADPAIRDFMGPTENYWDAAGPDGIPGFGALDPGLDVKRMVAELFGETTPDKPEAEQHDSANAPAQIEENIDAPDDRSKPADSALQQSAPQQNENGATQKQAAQEPLIQKMTRRHGGAMPE